MNLPKFLKNPFFIEDPGRLVLHMLKTLIHSTVELFFSKKWLDLLDEYLFQDANFYPHFGMH